jgi:hypothetical protein
MASQPDVYPLSYDPAQRAIQLATIAQGEDIRAMVVDFSTNQAFVHYGLSAVKRTVNSESLPYILSISPIQPHLEPLTVDKVNELFISRGCSYVFYNPADKYVGTIDAIASDLVMQGYLLGVQVTEDSFNVIGVGLEV